MGFDELKAKAQAAMDSAKDEKSTDDAIERAGDFLDQKTGSAHKERIDTAQEFADKHLGEK